MLIRMKPSIVLEDKLGAALMAALLLITVVNVFVRYFTDQSFAWTEEISCFLMLALAMAGSAAAVVRDSHIRVDYFLASGFFWAVLGLLSAQMAWDEFRYNETSPAIGVPKWWYSVWLPVFCGILCARSLQGWQRLRSQA